MCYVSAILLKKPWPWWKWPIKGFYFWSCYFGLFKVHVADYTRMLTQKFYKWTIADTAAGTSIFKSNFQSLVPLLVDYLAIDLWCYRSFVSRFGTWIGPRIICCCAALCLHRSGMSNENRYGWDRPQSRRIGANRAMLKVAGSNPTRNWMVSGYFLTTLV